MTSGNSRAVRHRPGRRDTRSSKGTHRAPFCVRVLLSMAIVLFAGCSMPATVLDGERLEPALGIQIVRIALDLYEDQSCGANSDPNPRDGPGEDGLEIIRVRLYNNGTVDVPSNALAFQGYMEDGTMNGPCKREYVDAVAGQATDLSLWFFIEYRGEGTTPVVDRVALLHDGQEVGRADLRNRIEPE